MRFIPERDPKGGSIVGNSYVVAHVECPYLWFLNYYWPWFDETGQLVNRGVKSQFQGQPLNRGTAFHEGMAELYLSGCRDGEDTGEWDIDRAVAKIDTVMAQLEDKYEKVADFEKDKEQVPSRLIAYYDKYGPNSQTPEWPDIRVLFDGQGRPLIEREWVVPLGYGEYIYSSKTDLLILDHGRIGTYEHKTSAPGMWVSNRRKAVHTDSQFTGEFFVMRELFPEENISTVTANIIVFGAKAGGDVAVREPTRRSVYDLEVFKRSTVDVLRSIDDRTQAFDEDLEASGDYSVDGINRIARMYFPDHGTRNGRCDKFRGCQHAYWCSRKGRETETMKSLVPRSVREVTEDRERPV